MRGCPGLFTLAWPDTEHVGLCNTILLIGEGGIQRPDGKCMRTRGFVQKWLDGNIERAQGLVVEVVQKIPKQAQVKTRTLGKIQ